MTKIEILNEFAKTRAAWHAQIAELIATGEDVSNYVFWDVREHFTQVYNLEDPEAYAAYKAVCNGALAARNI